MYSCGSCAHQNYRSLIKIDSIIYKIFRVSFFDNNWLFCNCVICIALLKCFDFAINPFLIHYCFLLLLYRRKLMPYKTQIQILWEFRNILINLV